MPIDQFSTEQMRTATSIATTAKEQEKYDEDTKTIEDWELLNRNQKSSTNTTTRVDDAEQAATTEPLITLIKSTPPAVLDEGSKFSSPNVFKEREQIVVERKYEKISAPPKKVTTFEETPSRTTDRLDRLIIEDVPKAPPPETTDDNPIKIMEEVISKYFPDTFLKAAIDLKNKSEPVFEEKNEEDDKLSLPPWNVEDGMKKENSTGRKAVVLDETESTKSLDVVELTTASTINPKTEPTTEVTPSTSPETSTLPIITPKVIVSAKNPDEIDLGGVIYRKMKLFPPAKSSTDVTTAATLSIPVVTQSKEQENKEATTPVGDRFKIYLPEYDKEAEDIETTETPTVKTFLPKFNFDKEEFDYGKQAQAKKAKQKEKDLKKYKVKSFEVTNAPVEDGSNERVTNNVFLETKEFKVHLASTKSQKLGEGYYTNAPIDQDSPVYELSKLAKKKTKLGTSEYEPTKFAKQTAQGEIQNPDDVGTTQTFMETNNPTTNPKPPHTWYSHAREKAKIKNALKIMKSTMTLDMNVKPTVDSMMEESNDINSMATQYTEREPRSAVAEVTYQDDLNNPQMFGQVKFNAPEGYAAAVSGSGDDEGTRLGVLSSMAVGAACFMAMASLVAVLWLRLKTGRSRMTKTESSHRNEENLRPVATTSNYETVYPVPRESDDYEVTTFFCPTFTNNYAERINREFKELSYDHPRRLPKQVAFPKNLS
ncbi:hypothetical protein GE061_009926 [Apolygus lucorum]|uniref:Uncharacterized protein n=1 Tax=Apolygus lucorum TaxID=248454 RepID=A0A8S9Y5R5_APOLU|nr:hypothetical protein GE061_009926 [Apolygus lucorum]